MDAILDIRSLNLKIESEEKTHQILSDVTLSVQKGQIMALFGPSGAGKSMLLKSIIRLFEHLPRIKCEGHIYFEGLNILSLDRATILSLRKNSIAYVFQSGQSILNPAKRINDQLSESLISLKNTDEINIKVKNCLSFLGFKDLDRILRAYPHELSGGQIQRILLALAILRDVKLLLIDEPTSALDAALKNEVVALIKNINKEFGITMIIVSHNSELIEPICDDIVYIENGKVVDKSPFQNEVLIAKNNIAHKKELVFNIKSLTKTFKSGGFFKKKEVLHLFNGLDLEIFKNEILGVAGPSGSGKSTLGLLITALDPHYDGQILYRGKALKQLTNVELKRFRKEVQIIFQDPLNSLSPHLTVKQIFDEVLDQFKINLMDWAGYLNQFGLDLSVLNRKANQLSGGQRQRIFIAKALLTNPEVLICDEITASLDPDVSIKILNLLRKLHNERQLTLLFISHDESLLNQFCHKTIRLNY